jgi:DNA-binding NarL/FixJ family response regulator
MAQAQQHIPPDANSVLIVDDHDIVRFGLETVISSAPDLHLVGTAANLADALAAIAMHQPALVITDMALPDSKGVDTVRAIVQAQQGRRTLVVSMQDEILYGELVLCAGANGFIMKETAYANIVPAALAVLAGHEWISRALNAKIVDRALHRNRPSLEAGGEATLTMRELEVLEQLKSGKTTKEIASALQISGRTVDLYRASIKRKLHLRTGVEVIAYAFNKL